MQWPMATAFTLTATLACVAVHAAQPAAATSKNAVQTAQAPEQPFLGSFLRETRIIYPLKLGDWHAAQAAARNAFQPRTWSFRTTC